ncbi:hypothetical protein RRG08_031336 [Elysia crispata]|uniref:Uncharacterized protein n=1 Tax=Elysia crispata TaxID=231223 RepID=A0AAE0YI20_9GAST|nr:hypothetical protein RRG08_031336 [Elysia crispata]
MQVYSVEPWSKLSRKSSYHRADSGFIQKMGSRFKRVSLQSDLKLENHLVEDMTPDQCVQKKLTTNQHHSPNRRGEKHCVTRLETEQGRGGEQRNTVPVSPLLFMTGPSIIEHRDKRKRPRVFWSCITAGFVGPV